MALTQKFQLIQSYRSFFFTHNSASFWPYWPSYYNTNQ